MSSGQLALTMLNAKDNQIEKAKRVLFEFKRQRQEKLAALQNVLATSNTTNNSSSTNPFENIKELEIEHKVADKQEEENNPFAKENMKEIRNRIQLINFPEKPNEENTMFCLDMSNFDLS